MDTTQYTVIKLEKKHLNQVAQIEKICFPCPWSEEQFETALIDKYTELYGLVYQDKIVSYLLCSVVIDYAEILNIATLPEYRKKGFAEELLKYWLNFEHIKNIKIILEVRSKNIPAQNLYKKFGFQQIHIRKNYYKDDDALVMER